MKRLLAIIALATALVAGPALSPPLQAVDAHHPKKKTATKKAKAKAPANPLRAKKPRTKKSAAGAEPVSSRPA